MKAGHGIIALFALTALAGCGKVGPLEPKTGSSGPAKAYGQTETPGAEALMEPSVQARPGRSDELMRRSERRNEDPFDLPPGSDPSDTAEADRRTRPSQRPKLISWTIFRLSMACFTSKTFRLPRIAEEVGTPVYVYSQATLVRHAQVFRDALLNAGVDNPHIAFAIKANPNLGVLRVLAKEGYGADVVSGGELTRALAAGIAPEDIVFSGVGKTAEEMVQGLKSGIGQFNIESEEEGRELAAIAETMGLRATAALRVNPDVDAKTHGKISTGKAENKFGVAYDRAAGIYGRLAHLPGLEMRGLAIHIGSQMSSLEPLEAAIGKLGALIRDVRASGNSVTHADLGGGLGVPYQRDAVLPTPEEYGAMVARATKGWDVRLMFEPGRVICGNAGVLLTRVIRVKPVRATLRSSL